MVRHGFHDSRPVQHFPTVKITEGELVALLVAQKALEQYRNTAFAKPLRSAFNKLVSGLQGETAISWDELSGVFSFKPVGLAIADLKNFDTISQAVLRSDEVEFSYQKLQGKTKERRRVQPYHLACINNQWYLFGKDLLRQGLRTFALSRVTAARNRKRPFVRPADFSAARFLEQSFAVFETDKPRNVVLRFEPTAARLVSERTWHPSQRLRSLPGDRAELSLRVGLSPDLTSWILGWGDQVEVVKPSTLRDAVRETCRRAARKHR